MPTKKYTLSDLKAKCKKMHIEFDNSGNNEYAIYSPEGYQFEATDAHVCIGNHMGVKEWKERAIKNLMEDIAQGLRKCPKNCLCKE